MAQGQATDPLIAAQAMNLADAGYTATQAGRMVGLPGRTVQDIINRHGRWGEIADTPVFAKLRAEQNKALEATARTMAADFWVHAHENKEKLSPYQAVVAGSILLDKAQLLAGLPTSIVETQASANLEQIAARLQQVVELRRQREIDVTPAENVGNMPAKG